MRLLLFCLLVVVIAVACAPSDAGPAWKKRGTGTYYRLLAFENMERINDKNDFAWLDLSFATLEDSVFWDSRSNFHNSFFLEVTPAGNDLLKKEVVEAAEEDSFCLLIEPPVFFMQRFAQSRVPVFCADDSAVKVYCKVREFMGKEAMSRLAPSLENVERKTIAAYFKDSTSMNKAFDKSGFYWVSRPSGNGVSLRQGDKVIVSYKGYFLNGRLMDDGESEFQMEYGDPSQLIAGLNNVMALLKAGQNAKIIIPSRLAFGSHGSSTGIVPPFTPLLYEISVKNGN